VSAVFALTTRGLEAVSAREMAALPGVTVTQTAYRRITARGDQLSALLKLRTVDDVYLDLATWTPVLHTRDELANLGTHAGELELDRARETVATQRPVSTTPRFSVTASFVGQRNYSADEIKTSIAESIAAKVGWNYTPDDREAEINLRIFIEHETAYVGLRLGERPLHERDYKVAERPGSLKPSVAAAMLRLADVKAGMQLLDPCCGAGTILIEGALMGADARGGDLDSAAVDAARANAAAAGVSLWLEQWDARALPLAGETVDCIVTNLPWGRQVAVDDELSAFYSAVCRRMGRVLRLGGRIAVLTNAPQLLHFQGLKRLESVEISLFGQKPTITVFENSRQ
jgi:tRNA (guanine6-N2)-methyltransferase